MSAEARGAGAPRAVRWWQEPLVHFLFLGGAAFVGHRLLSAPEPAVIRLGPAEVQGVRAAASARLGRPLTEAEAQAALEDRVAEELMVREALRLGLPAADPVVRRRLVEALASLAEAEADPGEPTEAELTAHLGAHPERFARPERHTLEQVFVAGGEGERERALALRARLLAGEAPGALGDAPLRGRRFEGRSARELSTALGAELGAAVVALPLERWSEPLRSPLGWHLVRVEARRPGGPAPLAEVRAAVREAVLEERRERARRAFEARLRARVRVELDHAP